MLKVVISIFLIMPILLTTMILMENEVGKESRAALRSGFEAELIAVDDWPQSQTFDALYILGGNPKAQRYKFAVVSKLYGQGVCQKVYMMSNKGLMGYNPGLGRNPTVDEWSVLKLEESGVRPADIEIISMDKGSLGTMTEAKNVAEVLSQSKLKNVVLVAAPYHSKRVRVTFEHFLREKGIDVVVLGSGEPNYLRYLALEWLKLKAYRILFLLDWSIITLFI